MISPMERQHERRIHVGDESIEVVPVLDPTHNAVTLRLNKKHGIFGIDTHAEITLTEPDQVDELINDLLHWRNVKWPWPKFREVTNG